MSRQHSRKGTVAEAYLAALADRGVAYVFANAGTDFAPIIEALLAASESNRAFPKFITVPHENVAVAMAHGYYRMTGQPAAVMVHVQVGTANALCGMMNAARDQVPLLLASGRTPNTETGDAGSRSIPIHWPQDNFDQGGIVREYVKWDYELRAGQSADDIVGRALDVAMSHPRGPVYLTLPREVLGAEAELPPPDRSLRRPGTPAVAPPADAMEEIADMVAAADRPLILAGGTGFGAELGALAERFALPVAHVIEPSLPSDHPMNLGFQVPRFLADADLVLVLDCMVPWIPKVYAPAEEAKVIHLGTDPLYGRLPVRGFRADRVVAGATKIALGMLGDALEPRMEGQEDRIAARARAVAGLRAEVASARSAQMEKAAGERPMSVAWVTKCLNEAKAEDAIVVNELGISADMLDLADPSCLMPSSQAGGLGFALGGALGAKLAAPERDVICCVGDGSYMFGNPTPAHFVGRAENLPTLTMVINNSQWFAVKRAALAMYPEGRAAAANKLPLVDLEPSPDFEKTIEACGGYGERVEDPGELPAAIRRGLDAVHEGRQALLNVIASAGGR